MPRYAQIKCDIYDDLVDEGYSQEAIAVYLFYSITSQNLIGLYRTVPNRDRVSANMDTLSWEKGKAELEKGGKVLWRQGFVWIVGKAKFVKGEKLVAAAKKCFSEIPNDVELKSLFAKKYDTLSIGNPLQDAPIPKPKPKRTKTAGLVQQTSSDPIQNEAEKVVTRWEKKIPGVKLNYGLVKNMLMGQKGFEVLLCGTLERFVDRLAIEVKVKKVKDPLTRFIDMAYKPAGYLE